MREIDKVSFSNSRSIWTMFVITLGSHLKQRRRQGQRNRHLKLSIWEMVTLFCDYCFTLPYFIVDRARSKWTVRSAVEVNIANERFTVVCSRCRENLKCGNFTLSFGRLRQGIVLKCVPHVQHDYFSLFNQSDHCFLALAIAVAVVPAYASYCLPWWSVYLCVRRLTSLSRKVGVYNVLIRLKLPMKTLFLHLC